MGNDINDLEEIEFDMHSIELINELSRITWLDESPYFRNIKHKKLAYLINVEDNKLSYLKNKITVKLKELFDLNNISFTKCFSDNYLYRIFYTQHDNFFGYVGIFEGELIVLETKDNVIYPLFKIRGDSNGQ